MREQFRVQSSAFKVRTGNISLCIFLLLLTLDVSPFQAFASEINSRAAVVMEASTGRILYGKNANLKLAPASTTKLMTVMVALDRMNPSDTVVISERAA
ncbi:MAG TPA: D-alanyl-D-alanine carboxypeptidase, partial [Thermodesulfovibrionales bacterium]|nr:D-alanyl-D-alanine carboxypeptidase [Thermodesulfovibrionales bacterium]